MQVSRVVDSLFLWLDLLDLLLIDTWYLDLDNHEQLLQLLLQLLQMMMMMNWPSLF